MHGMNTLYLHGIIFQMTEIFKVKRCICKSVCYYNNMMVNKRTVICV